MFSKKWLTAQLASFVCRRSFEEDSWWVSMKRTFWKFATKIKIESANTAFLFPCTHVWSLEEAETSRTMERWLQETSSGLALQILFIYLFVFFNEVKKHFGLFIHPDLLILMAIISYLLQRHAGRPKHHKSLKLNFHCIKDNSTHTTKLTHIWSRLKPSQANILGFSVN